VTKEQLEQRMAELQKILEQLQANGNATLGAISECRYWLAQLEAKKTTPEKGDAPKKAGGQ